jgi:cellulose synthase/poly-beta-1,6-N-acetylglucosamine synthase-like glycosyltransferase
MPSSFYYSSVIPFSLFLLFMFGILFVTRILIICKDRKKRRRQQNEGDNDMNNTNDDDDMAMASVLAVQLGTEDRVRLYHRAFERNTHYHTLTADDFLGDVDIDIESSGEQHCEYDDDEDSPCIYLSLESSPPQQHPEEEHHQQQQSPHSDDVPKQDNASSENAASTTGSEKIVDTTTTTTETKTKIPGTCIICFEDFCAGETVVHSDNPDICKHVFHEDCMVRYLASHSQRTKVGGSTDGNRNNNSNNRYAHTPCPTCRQPFCQVSHEDLIIAVLLQEQHSSSLPEETTATSNSDSNSERIVAVDSLPMALASVSAFSPTTTTTPTTSIS